MPGFPAREPKTCKPCGTTDPGPLGWSRNGYCVPCNRAYGRANYQANKVRYFEQAKARTRAIKDYIDDQKRRPCADCGATYPPIVMDFDHVGDKSFGLAEMKKRKMALDKIKAEIAKCEVVCSNCHRLRTQARRGAA